MLHSVLALLRRIRAVLLRCRLRLWAATTTLRLRRRRCACRVAIGAGVRCAVLPSVRVLGSGGGSVRIDIGDGVDLGRALLIDINADVASSLSVGPDVQFEHAVRIQLLGGSISLGRACEVRDNATLKASSLTAALTIGENVKIGRSVAIHCHDAVVIEDLVTLAERVTVVDSFHDVDGSDRWTMFSPLGTAPVRLERNVMILTGAVIMHGTTIGRNAVVSANALVPSGSHKPGFVLVGNPARAVRQLAPGLEPTGG
jgi:acetyltransferase-like isoleucine patch superfamily enzyme